MCKSDTYKDTSPKLDMLGFDLTGYYKSETGLQVTMAKPSPTQVEKTWAYRPNLKVHKTKPT